MVTVSFLSFMSRIETFRLILRILKGPLYGGTNGPLTVSARIPTWVQVCRSHAGRMGDMRVSSKQVEFETFAVSSDRRRSSDRD